MDWFSNDLFKPKGLRCVVSLYFTLFFTIALVVIDYYSVRLHLHTPKQLFSLIPAENLNKIKGDIYYAKSV